MKAAKPRNPKAQDATLININALKARVSVLEAEVKQLRSVKKRMDHLEDAFFDLFNVKSGLKRSRR